MSRGKQVLVLTLFDAPAEYPVPSCGMTPPADPPPKLVPVWCHHLSQPKLIVAGVPVGTIVTVAWCKKNGERRDHVARDEGGQ